MSAKEMIFEKDTDVMSDEMLDDIIKSIAEEASAEDSRTSIINYDKVKLVVSTYNILKCLSKDKCVKVTYKLNEPYRSMGSVSVVGKNIIFDKPELFTAAAKLASNVDIFPKTDGSIQIDFTFHGLTKVVE